MSHLLPRGGTRYEGYVGSEEEALQLIEAMKESQQGLSRAGWEEDSCIRVFATARLPKLGSGVVCHSYFDVKVMTSNHGTVYERKVFELNVETVFGPTLVLEAKLYESLQTLRENPEEAILVESGFDEVLKEAYERYLVFNPENVPGHDHPRAMYVVQ